MLSIYEVLSEHQQINRFTFDVELLYIARRKGFSISEVPVSVQPDHFIRESKVHLIRDSVDMLYNLFKIRRNAQKGLYD